MLEARHLGHGSPAVAAGAVQHRLGRCFCGVFRLISGGGGWCRFLDFDAISFCLVGEACLDDDGEDSGESVGEVPVGARGECVGEC